MTRLVSRVLRFTRHEEEAATVAEYGLLLLLIVGVVIVAVGLLGGSIQGLYNSFNQVAP